VLDAPPPGRAANESVDQVDETEASGPDGTASAGQDLDDAGGTGAGDHVAEEPVESEEEKVDRLEREAEDAAMAEAAAILEASEVEAEETKAALRRRGVEEFASFMEQRSGGSSRGGAREGHVYEDAENRASRGGGTSPSQRYSNADVASPPPANTVASLIHEARSPSTVLMQSLGVAGIVGDALHASADARGPKVAPATPPRVPREAGSPGAGSSSSSVGTPTFPRSDVPLPLQEASSGAREDATAWSREAGIESRMRGGGASAIAEDADAMSPAAVRKALAGMRKEMEELRANRGSGL